MNLKDELKIKIEKPNKTNTPTYFNFENWFDSKVQPEIDRWNKIIDESEHLFSTPNGCWSEEQRDIHSHEFLQLGKREIVKKECKHKNVIGENQYPHNFKCQHCLKKLKPNWELV